MNKIKLIEVKDCEPERVTMVATLCENCGHLNNLNVTKFKIDTDEITSRINDELDICKVRIERILNGVNQ